MISNDDLELIVNKWSFYDKVKYYKNIGDETKYHELVLTEINKKEYMGYIDTAYTKLGRYKCNIYSRDRGIF